MKHYFIIKFSDLSNEKQIEIKESLVKTEGLEDKIVQPFDMQDVDAVEDMKYQIVDEACQVAWCELGIEIKGVN